LSAEQSHKHSAEIEAEAADWLARLDRDGRIDVGMDLDVLAREVPGFADWLESGIQYRIAILRLLAVWQRTHRLAALSRPETVSHLPKPRAGVMVGTGLAACLALALIVMMIFPISSPYRSQPSLVYETPIGSSRDIALPDGSVITLNSATRLTVRLGPSYRIVQLEAGEAFFVVSPDARRPFRVLAGDGEVQVRGTSFAVRRSESVMEVLVSEGVVSLSRTVDDIGSTVLTAGMVGYASADGVLIETVGPETIYDRLLWRQGRLRFDATPLSKVASEFNRYNTTRMIIGDDAAAAIEIGGTFPLDEVEAFARLAENGLGLKVRRRPGEIEISSE
jgi:transmembrane sensor